MPGIVVRLELSLEFLVRFLLESRQYQISPNLSSRSRADTCGQTDGHNGYNEASRLFFFLRLFENP